MAQSVRIRRRLILCFIIRDIKSQLMFQRGSSVGVPLVSLGSTPEPPETLRCAVHFNFNNFSNENKYFFERNRRVPVKC